MRDWLTTLGPSDMDGPCLTETTGAGHPFWYHLQHVYSHALQQFADAATLLSATGNSPGELDFLEWAESRETAT